MNPSSSLLDEASGDLEVGTVAGGPGIAPSWRTSPADLVLAPGEIHVFAFALDLPPSQVERLARLLSNDERARAEQFRRAEDFAQFVVRRARMRTILGHYLKLEATGLQFCYGAQGKPALAPDSRGSANRLRFNLTRSQGLGLLAIQLDEDLGIDLEQVRLFPDALPIARRLFAAAEYEALLSLPIAERGAAFFHYWTRKEAVLKSIGRGLSIPVNAFTLSQDPGEPPELVIVPAGDGTISRWSLPVPEPCVGYLAALATAGAPRSLRCWTWTDR